MEWLWLTACQGKEIFSLELVVVNVFVVVRQLPLAHLISTRFLAKRFCAKKIFPDLMDYISTLNNQRHKMHLRCVPICNGNEMFWRCCIRKRFFSNAFWRARVLLRPSLSPGTPLGLAPQLCDPSNQKKKPIFLSRAISNLMICNIMMK